MLARQNNDKVGLCLFDDEVRSYIPPGQSGRNHSLRLLYELVAQRTPRPATNVANALEYISSHQRKRSIIFLLSDYYTPPFENELRKVAMRHETTVVHCMDNAEALPPAVGLVCVQDAETGEVRTIDTSARSARKNFPVDRTDIITGLVLSDIRKD
jgi:uncharacterized protein (DUF58 family)